MSNKQKQSNTKNVKSKSKSKTNNDDNTIIVNDKKMTIDEFKNELIRQLQIATKKRDGDECKRIRNQLRKKCKHYGALRNRTYIDKITNVKHVVNQTT